MTMHNSTRDMDELGSITAGPASLDHPLDFFGIVDEHEPFWLFCLPMLGQHLAITSSARLSNRNPRRTPAAKVSQAFKLAFTSALLVFSAISP